MEQEIMSREEIFSAVEKITNGRMARVRYRTELPIKAAYKKKGYKVVKEVETTARFGCKYSNLESVIKKRSNDPNPDAPKKVHKDNYTWILENKICHNESTGKDYIRFAPMNNGGSNKKSAYVVTYEGAVGSLRFSCGAELPEMFKNIVLDSYWKDKTPPEVQNVSIENVIFVKSSTGTRKKSVKKNK